MNDEPLIGQIDQPYFWGTVAGVERQLDLRIISQGSVRYFHEQQYIVRGWMGAAIKIRPRTQQRDIGLRF